MVGRIGAGRLGNHGFGCGGGGAAAEEAGTGKQRQACEADYLCRSDEAHYEHTQIGDNDRMSNSSAGIGRGQMEVLDKWVE